MNHRAAEVASCWIRTSKIITPTDVYHYSITEADTVRKVSEFLEEATIMHKFDHPNVLTLLGVVIEKNTPYVIMPLMKHGDLKGFIADRDRVRTM